MSFLNYFERFAPTSWFDGGLTEVDEIVRKGETPIMQRAERVQSKVGGLLWGAATSVAIAGVIAAGVVTGTASGGTVERVAVAPIPLAASAHFHQLVISQIAAHDYAPPGVWADAMSALASMKNVDETKYVDVDSFF